MFNGTRDAYDALMHDAAEAYAMDIPVPMKRYVNSNWHHFIGRVEGMICIKYGCSNCNPDVAKLDKALVAYEMNNAISRTEGASKMRYPMNLPYPLSHLDTLALAALERQLGWDPLELAQQFLQRFQELRQSLNLAPMSEGSCD